MRPNWDEYFMKMCDVASERATCDRKHVGAVLVRGQRLIGAGYNGSLPGIPHCDEIGHDMDEGHCVRTVHAEVNAVCQAARLGISTEGATLYCNTLPCWHCFKTIISAGIKEIVYRDEYRPDKHQRVHEASRLLEGFVLRQFQPTI